ncbi:LysR family transcriptional regulator [Paraburkholderia fungorum]|jgi:DNA-binding transcriptional LysR family regulator|uniref:LysR family transcriptional regulator n=1 Tax=Paraburkholderia fungorum TaxID=134537 RepID=UPI00241F94FA|nr:LysR family transcriptional regulator [Paraburkholderia fungorum]
MTDRSDDNALWMRRLRMRHLESFLVLVSAGNLTLAAARLHMTQSAVSHWLGEMEDIVGTRLIVRGKQLQLTPAGEAVRKLASRILGEVNRTSDELSSIASGELARLNIGCITAGLANLLPHAILRFRASYPQLCVQISEGNFDDLLERLELRELDLVIGAVDSRAFGDQLERIALCSDNLAAIASSTHPLRRCDAIEWSDVFEYPLIMPPRGTLMRQRLDAVLLERDGAHIRAAIETGSVTALESIVRMSTHIGICSATIAKQLALSGKTNPLPLTSPLPFGPIGAVWRRGVPGRTLSSFISALRETASKDCSTVF